VTEFLNEWFQGLEKGLAGLNVQEQGSVLEECGKACSKSFSLGIYKMVREQSTDTADFFERLKGSIPEIDVFEVEKGKVYEIHYTKCLCDLYVEGLITNGFLCECSRRSLLYNLKCVFPEKMWKVLLLESILRGKDRCVLRVLSEEKIDVSEVTD